MSRLAYLDKGLALGPATLKNLVTQIDPARCDQPAEPDRFTVREVVAHLADWEPVIRGRMESAMSNPGGAVPNWDESREAEIKNYRAWDVVPTLEKFAQERRATLGLFTSLSEAQLAQTIKHPAMGEISVFDLAILALGHDAYHLEQVSQYLPK